MSWVKMTTFLSVIKSLKRVLIIAWKVAGEFVNLKKMTVGSYSPRFIEEHITPRVKRLTRNRKYARVYCEHFDYINKSLSFH